ncbi:MAG: PsbP-related protein [bacterium]|nr:PsbP-related protein [bacterium]
MQQPKGIAVVLGVLLGLVVVGVVVGGILLFKGESKTQIPVVNTNTALQLVCNSDADCISYCGGDSNYQPICGVTVIGAAGFCTCRSIAGSAVTTGNTNVTTNTNTNANANVNASTNANTSSTVSTTSWKMYSDPQTRFTFLYPTDGVISTTELQVNQLLAIDAFSKRDGLLELMRVYVFSNPSKLTSAQWVANIKKAVEGPPGYETTFADRVTSESVTTLDGLPAVKLVTSQTDHSNAEVYIAAGTNIFFISYETDGAGNDSYTSADRKVYETILSTLTFTK